MATSCPGHVRLPIQSHIQHLIHEVEEEDDRGRGTGKKSQIFRRYHQVDTVRWLIQDAGSRGTGQRYLVQHSDGSGKSMSIAWLAHQLSSLHDDDDRRVFDSIIVVTDRRVLDRQLDKTIRSFEKALGVVEHAHSAQELKQALEQKKNSIVSTLQKFPCISQEIGKLPGSRFAVIVDEAHSSRSGEMTRSLKQVLATESLEDAEREDELDEDIEDQLVAEMRSRGPQKNVSTFAFTATPKEKTLELFGHRDNRGRYAPFSLYSMRQAIEEGFILVVLQNYTTYQTYWKLLKTAEDDPTYERDKAHRLLRAFVELHDHAIGEKVRIMVEHFHQNVAHRINGRAKAMIVNRSRLHAVRYHRALERYLKEQGYDHGALVAFSGTVRDGGIEHTEANLNGIPETQIKDAFERAENRFLVVANKFQTGFDQPLLHTMYVDKKLGVVNAVQTLSRLNRTHPAKDGTMVLDFANEAEAIREAFEPYYEHTILSEGTDPNLLHDLQTRIQDHHLFGDEETTAFAKAYFALRARSKDDGDQPELYRILDPVKQRFVDHLDPEAQEQVRSDLNEFVRHYAFLSQIVTFSGPIPEFAEHRECDWASQARRGDAGIASLFRGAVTQHGAPRRARMPATLRIRPTGRRARAPLPLQPLPEARAPRRARAPPPGDPGPDRHGVVRDPGDGLGIVHARERDRR
jgi:type I restriction enzyme, R subunit